MYDDEDEVGRGIPWVIYVSRALSAWGDRLWSFGIGIFMNVLGPKNLRLVAIYGFSTSVSVIFFGALLGSWVDKASRLSAAKTFLAIQNLLAAVCCAILALYFGMLEKDTWPEWVTEALPTVTIVFAVIANLASLGSKISVEKDWVSVIAAGDNDKLAKMNSTFRTIDLLCLLVAPLLAGLVFDYTSNMGAAIFIAIWNLISVIAEYALLLSIYIRFPALAHKQSRVPANFDDDKPSKWSLYCCCLCRGFASSWNAVISTLLSWKAYMVHPAKNAGIGLAFLYMTVLGFDNITYGYCMKMCVKESVLGGLVGVSAIFGVSGSILFPMLRRKLEITRTGSLGFACLISVLILSVVSIGLPGSLFVPEKIYEVFGGVRNPTNPDDDSISTTISLPKISSTILTTTTTRKPTTTITLPSTLTSLNSTILSTNNNTTVIVTASTTTSTILETSSLPTAVSTTTVPTTAFSPTVTEASTTTTTTTMPAKAETTSIFDLPNTTLDNFYYDDNSTDLDVGKRKCYSPSYFSVGFFLAGIISARFGLWIADLAINQILQEQVIDENRGRINGVQSGLNSFMNTLKYLLVILMPETETFGWLIILSFLFVCIGALFYVCYAAKTKIESETPVVETRENKYEFEDS